jgi:hypothetical protein
MNRSTRALRLAVFAAASVCLAAPAHAGDIFSPGELARAHASLEGLSNCTQCHPAGEQLSQEKCLDCHTELRGKVKTGKGFHGRIAEDKRACESCHHDHQGREFAMVDWGAGGKKAFEHGKTGWPLKGKHAGVDCKKCHDPRLITDGVIIQLRKKQPERETYLGVAVACKACHFDEHRGQEGLDCAKCHNEAAWKPAPGFAHDKTHYPLEGKHKPVKCEKCHGKSEDSSTPKDVFPAPLASSFMKMKDLPHASCLDCHKDPHDGRLGESCKTCHVVDGWLLVRAPAKERAFHEKTRFPLKGEHADVACRACHGPWPGVPVKFKGLPHDTCMACHADGHEGQFARAAGAKSAACERCHTVDGFLPARFEIEEHAKTRYPLEGAHKAVSCGLCHFKDVGLLNAVPVSVKLDLAKRKRPEKWSPVRFALAVEAERCQSCHVDAHAGQLGKAGAADQCSACHQTSTFHEVRFDHEKNSRYPLTGKHAKVACGSCHIETVIGGKSVVRYKPIDLACASCHPDIHAAQLALRRGDPTDCLRCHTTDEWKKTRFVHEPPFTNYRLDGKHAKVACEKCHPAVAIGAGEPTRRYKGLPQACEGCHSDFHRGAFKGFEP